MTQQVAPSVPVAQQLHGQKQLLPFAQERQGPWARSWVPWCFSCPDAAAASSLHAQQQAQTWC